MSLDLAWEGLKREFDTACAQTEQAARLRLSQELNQAARRLRQYQSEEDWAAAVLDAAQPFAGQLALFSFQGESLRLRGARELDLPEDFSFALASAPAFANAVNSKDSIIALRTAGEVGDALAAPGATQRAHVIPILNRDRVAALLFATGEASIDLSGLELVTTMASLVLERQVNTAKNLQISPVAPTLAFPNAELPPWSALSEEQRNLHLRAQRFSRVKVAEMQLAHPEACHAGLEQNDVYLFLKKEIDSARNVYRAQFMSSSSMVDYLHLELVRTAAEGDESKLGADYPGQMV
jgi:hypothetical protein